MTDAELAMGLRSREEQERLWGKRHEDVWMMFSGEETNYPDLPAFDIYCAATEASQRCRQRARVFAEAASYLEP